jgi:protein-export membrane protein SecD
MQRKLTWIWGLIAVLLLLSGYTLWPTIRLASMDDEAKLAAEQRDPAEWLRLKNRAIKLGLDLRGGMRVVMEVDKSKLNAAEAQDAVDRAKEIIRNRVDQFGVSEPLIQKQGENRIVIELPGITDVTRAQELIGRTAQLEFKLLEPRENVTQILERIDLALEARDSTAEPSEQADNPEDIFDIFSDSAKQADSPQADSTSLTQTEDDSAPLGDHPFSTLLEPIGEWYRVTKDDAAWIRKWLDDPKVQKEIPADIQVAWGTKTEFAGGLEVEYLYFVKANVEMSGKYLTEARPNFDQFRKPIVDFVLTREGGKIFARVTGANIGKPLAIVLDDRVISAPTIQSRIPDRGQITMGNADYEEAADLAIMLRAGALPAPVNVVESNVIGPSLGADSIKKGITASVIGLLVVLIFILVYYRLSGAIADIAILLNVVFLMAVMVVLDATLTMPGIAGIILTVGMADDANVLIFERIREELRKGKTIRAAIDVGYARALVAIIDSHVTTLITALALFLFGTGPVKGFAVTLAWGVVINLFTAYVITKAVFDLRKGYKSLSI